MTDFAYRFFRGLGKLLCRPFFQIQVLRREAANREGAWILASNHFSHFDPPLISIASPRCICWMAMAELFQNPILARLFRSVGAFSVNRKRANRETFRIATKNLREGKVIGIFPESGIRAEAASILHGGAMRRGVIEFSVLMNAPIVPCVILDSAQLYRWKNWLRFRRTKVFVAFGNPIFPPQNLEKFAKHDWLKNQISSAFQQLYQETCAHFSIANHDLSQAGASQVSEIKNR